MERRDDFSYPARGSAAFPGTIFRGGPELTGTPERSAGGWAVTATRREGGAQRDRRQPISCGDLTLLQTPRQRWDGCMRARGSHCCSLYSPRALPGRTKTCRQGCPVAVMLPPVPSVALSRWGAPVPTNPPVAPFFLTLRRHRKRQSS